MNQQTSPDYLGVVEYIRKNSTHLEGISRHRQLIRDLMENPSLIGITDVLETYPEVDIRERGRRETKVDLVYITKNGVYIIEAKTNNISTKRRNSGSAQLELAYNFLRETFGIAPRMILVSSTKGRIKHREKFRPIEDILIGFEYPSFGT